MVKRHILIGAIVLLLIGGLVVLLSDLCSKAGVYVTVVNNTPGNITDVNIAYTGGVIHIAALESKASCSKWVSPAGDSGMDIDWVDPSEVRRSGKIDVYLTRYSGGTMVVTLAPDNSVSWTTDGI
jgi:hypothetical protein